MIKAIVKGICFGVIIYFVLSVASCKVEYTNTNSGDYFCFKGPMNSDKCVKPETGK